MSILILVSPDNKGNTSPYGADCRVLWLNACSFFFFHKHMALGSKLLYCSEHSTLLSCSEHSTLLYCSEHSTLLYCSEHSTFLSCSEHSTFLSCSEHSTFLSCSEHSTFISCSEHSTFLSCSEHSQYILMINILVCFNAPFAFRMFTSVRNWEPVGDSWRVM